jgi:hypothetical protein
VATIVCDHDEPTEMNKYLTAVSIAIDRFFNYTASSCWFWPEDFEDLPGG